MINMESNLFNNIELLDKICDIARIVDPIKKKVIEYKNNSEMIFDVHCFDFLGKNKVCDNCISMRAYNDNLTYVKIEYVKDKVYLITAIPHIVENRTVVIEIIKDITRSVLFDVKENSVLEHTGIHELIDNMNKMTYLDPLTGIYNRRYIMEKLPVDLINSALSSNELSIIMADIDFFKKVNDNYGHIAGDLTLKVVAGALSGCLKRDSDWIARFGGEEFLICMPDASIDIAVVAAESMRKALEKLVIHDGEKEFNITASFGVYCYSPSENVSADDLIKRADEKLYLAKENGRNRVEY